MAASDAVQRTPVKSATMSEDEPRSVLPWNIGQDSPSPTPARSPCSPLRETGSISPRNAHHELVVSELRRTVRLLNLENKTVRGELQAALKREQDLISLLKQGGSSAATFFEKRVAELSAEKEDALAKLVQLSLEINEAEK